MNLLVLESLRADRGSSRLAEESLVVDVELQLHFLLLWLGREYLVVVDLQMAALFGHLDLLHQNRDHFVSGNADVVDQGVGFIEAFQESKPNALHSFLEVRLHIEQSRHVPRQGDQEVLVIGNQLQKIDFSLLFLRVLCLLLGYIGDLLLLRVERVKSLLVLINCSLISLRAARDRIGIE